MYKRIIICLLILIVMVGATLPYPAPVYAATQTRAVTGYGTLTNPGFESYIGGANDWSVLNSEDHDTSFWFATTAAGGYKYTSWEIQDFAEADDITNVRLTSKLRSTSVNHVYHKNFVYIGGTKYLGVETEITNAVFFAEYSTDWATNPATGLQWTAAQLNAAEFGNGFQTPVGAQLQNTFLYVTVTYNPETLPAVNRGQSSNIIYDGACKVDLNGEVTDDGGADIDMRGFAWSSTSNSTDPTSDEEPPASYSANWTEVSADFGEGTFSYTATLNCCTTYWFRAYAHNSEGWAWSAAQNVFTTLCNPNIDTNAATYVEATTARLNALLVDDGGQPADVRFSYGTSTANCTDDAVCNGSCNTTSYDTTTAWINDTYTTGQKPFVDITGLTASTTYYFCSQTRNDYSCECGGEESFTTETGIHAPDNLKGIPTATTVSLFWVKIPGSTNTLVRYKLGTYPTANDGSDGSVLVYFDTQTSELHEGLTPGTTYFYMAWGESGGTYSADNMTLMITTLASVAGGDPLPCVETPASWYQAPNHSNMSNLPFYGLINWAIGVFEVPLATGWSFIAMFLSVCAGILAYVFRDSHNLLMALVVTMVAMVFFTFMQLISFWILVPYILFAITGIFVGERR